MSGRTSDPAGEARPGRPTAGDARAQQVILFQPSASTFLGARKMMFWAGDESPCNWATCTCK
eukprot:6073057-Alexandrium_andersonii.AAC.1